ncbi:MAG TPA: hypothetical protein VH309_00850, partial [Elusimicrobiota bacterium]|nr:hypothetical protein [Elusimicrobiota bacterium]
MKQNANRTSLGGLALVQPPAYDWLTPSNGLALMNAHLKAAGIIPTIVDSSMRVRKALAARLKRDFKDQSEYHKTLTRHPKIVAQLLDREIDEILSTAPA